MLLIDPKTGKIVDANEAARKFYGYSAAQFKRLTIYKINSMDRAELESIVKKILARKCNSFNTRHRLANGEIRDVEVHSSPVDHQTRLLLFAIVTDMAEKMQAGRNLQKMEAEYRDLFEHVLDGVYRSTPRGKLLAVNPAMVHILGYDSAEELLQVDIARDLYVDPKQRLVFKRELAAHDQVRNLSAHLRCKDGREIHVLDNSYAVRNEKGKVLYYEGTLTDVTELRQAEDALRESEERYRSTIENAAIGVSETWLDGRFSRVNNKLCEITGYSREELLSMTYKDITHPDDLSHDMEQTRLLLDGKLPSFSMEKRYICKGGGIVWVNISVSLLRDGAGEPVSVVAAVQDIQGRKDAEQALIESEQKNRSLVENAVYGIYRTTARGLIISANPALVKLLGYESEKELILQRSSDLYDDPQEALRIDRQLAERGSIRNEESVLKRKDGRRILVKDNTHSVTDSQGNILYYEGSLIDITDERRVDDALRRHVNELELLYENSITVSMTFEPHQIARQLIDLIDRKMNWHHAAIRYYNRDANKLELLALNIPNRDDKYIRREMERLNGMISRPGQGLSGWVIKTGETVRSGSVHTDSRYVDTYPNLRSGLYVPMKVGDRVIGSIAVESETPNAFDDGDERLLVTLAAQAGVAIDNARLFIELQERASEFEVLYETTHDLMNFKNVRSLLDIVTERAVKLMNVSGVTIYLYDPQAAELELVSTPDPTARLGIRLKMGEGLSGRVAESRQPLVVEDYSHWEGRSYKFEDIAYDSVLGVPMVYSGELVGVLNVYETPSRAMNLSVRKTFGDSDVRLASLFASAAAGAVYSARLFERVNHRAEELSALARVSSALRSASTRVQMLPVILDQLMDLMSADGALISFIHFPDNNLVVELGRGSLSGLTALKIPGERGLTGHLVESREPYFTTNIQNEGMILPIEGVGNVRVAGAVPLIAQERVIGLLWVVRDLRPDGLLPVPFSENKQHLLSAVADMAASAIHRASLHEKTALHAEQMAGVSHLGRLMAETTNLETLYRRLAEGIYSLLSDVCGSFISLYNAENQMVTCVSGHVDGKFIDPSTIKPFHFEPMNGDEPNVVIASQQPVIMDEIIRPAEKIGQVGNSVKVARSALYVPMLADGRIIGMIEVQSYSSARFKMTDRELLTLVANTAAVEIENARLISRYERHVQRLTALHAIDTAINSSTDMRLSLRVVLEQAIHLLDLDAASVLLMNPITLMLDFVAGSGFRVSKASHASIRLGEGLAGRAALQRTPVQSSDRAAIRACFVPSLIDQENFQGYMGLPLISKGKVSGVLQLFSHTSMLIDQEWLDFLNVLGDQVALAVNNSNLFEGLERANIELTMAYDATIEGWSRALDLRDHDTEGHTQRVTELTVALAQAMGIPEQTISQIRRGALLHDIGKMGVPDEILRKPGGLTEDEWEIMRQHPRLAYELLSQIVYLRSALDIPYSHHEKWDGSGYPQGLKGEAIPLAARLFAIVDVYDALTSDRPYRKAWPREKVLESIKEGSGKHFDPQIVAVFLRLMDESAYLDR